MAKIWLYACTDNYNLAFDLVRSMTGFSYGTDGEGDLLYEFTGKVDGYDWGLHQLYTQQDNFIKVTWYDTGWEDYFYWARRLESLCRDNCWSMLFQIIGIGKVVRW